MTRRLFLVLLSLLPATVAAQLHPFNGRDRDRGHLILSVVAHDLRAHFWDPGLKQLPFDSLVAAADSEISLATSYAQLNGAIAKVALALDDSHTRYYPPSTVNRIDLGWAPYPVGDSVYLRDLEPRVTAPPYGLHLGDRLVAIDGWPVERRHVDDVVYLRQHLQPHASVVLTVDSGDGSRREVAIPVVATPGRAYYDLSGLSGVGDFYQLIREEESGEIGWDARFAEVGTKILYWRLRSFAVSDGFIRDCLRRARGKETLILDLRGNRGGYVSTLTDLLGRLAHPDQVGDTLYIERKRDRRAAQIVPRIVEQDRWSGRLIVLVDGESMSASEAFADGVQRLGLGTVLGDRTPGFLTEAEGWSHITSEATSVMYGISIATAMLERPDGSRVEGVGVIPDELVQPTPEDLVHKHDPVLARALQIAGQEYDPTMAYVYSHLGMVNVFEH